jgi:hypothetical protein
MRGRFDEARRLRRRWHEAFWVEEDGAYAMALDPDKRPVRSMGSNPGHALAAGLVPRERARAVADRLLSPELFSGWGVRTLAADHPSYNPFAYHLSTVWPVENATFVLGMRRYGLGDHADRIVTGLFEAARHFTDLRLPEAWSGEGPGETPVPIPYPAANSPQAWSASAAIQLVQMIVGLYPFAPARLLAVVEPRLPAWLPALTIRDLRVGDARVSLHFRRAADGSASFEVIHRTGTIHVVRVPPPDPADPEDITWPDGLKDWLPAARARRHRPRDPAGLRPHGLLTGRFRDARSWSAARRLLDRDGVVAHDRARTDLRTAARATRRKANLAGLPGFVPVLRLALGCAGPGADHRHAAGRRHAPSGAGRRRLALAAVVGPDGCSGRILSRDLLLRR